MKITKEILESTVKDIAKVVLPAVVDEDFNIDEKAPYELYNAIVGTVFDEAGYNKVVNDSPEFLYYHIPGGSRMTSDKKSLDITGDDKVDAEDVEAIDEILNKENITKEDIEKGDVSGDFKVDTHDKKLVEKEAERQKKSTIDVDTDSVYTEEEAVAYNATLPGAIKEGDEVDSNEVVPYEFIHDEESWELSAGNGVLSRYYAQYPDEDHWNITENRAGNFNDKVYEVEIGNEVHDFAAYWQSDNVQKITNLEDPEEVYYLDMFYSLDEDAHELFTDAALTESANKTATFTKVKWNAETCPQCWEGAVNAPGAKLPWVAIMFDEDVNAKVRFDYEGKDSVYPWGDTLFGIGENKKSWGLASPAKEFGDNTFALVANGGSDAFDGGNFQITLVHTVTAEEAIEFNSKLEGAVKAGDKK